MIVQNFIYFVIFLFITGQLFRLDLMNGVVIQVTDFFLIIGITGWLFSHIYNNTFWKISSYPFFKPFILFVSVALLSLIVNIFTVTFNELLISSLYLFRWCLYFCLIWMVSGLNLSQKKRIFLYLSISGIIFVALGFVQYFFYPNLRNLYYLEWDDHLFRMFSTLFDPNFAAAIFCILLFMLIPWLFYPAEKKNIRIAAMCAATLTFFALLLTYSRSGYCMFIVGSAVSLWLLGKKKLIMVIFFFMLIGVILVPKTPGSAGVELWRVASIVARSESAKQAITIYKDHPVFGIGFNTYRYVQRAYGFTQGKNWVVSHSGAGTDNSMLFTLVTTGIVGLCAYLYLWSRILAKSYTVYKAEKQYNFRRMLSIIILSSCAGLLVDSIFINSLFYPMVMFWMWVLIGLLV